MIPEWIVQQGGMAALAAFAIWMLKTVMEERVSDKDAQLKEAVGDKQILLSALSNNTTAMEGMKDMMEALVGRQDKVEACLGELLKRRAKQ